MATYPTQDTYNYDDFVLGTTEGTELVTIATGQTLEAGQVLAKSTADGEYYAYDPVGTDGLNEISRILKDDIDTSAGAADSSAHREDANGRLHHRPMAAARRPTRPPYRPPTPPNAGTRGGSVPAVLERACGLSSVVSSLRSLLPYAFVTKRNTYFS